MAKAEERASEHTGYCHNESYKDFLAGYRQAVSDVIDLIENGEGFDIVAGYGERCELIGAIKKFIE